jgi:hypothetical protein
MLNISSALRCAQDLEVTKIFKIKRTSPLKKKMDAWAQRQGRTADAYRFIFNGNRFVATATPDAVRLMSCRAVYPRSWLLAVDLA